MTESENSQLEYYEGEEIEEDDKNEFEVPEEILAEIEKRDNLISELEEKNKELIVLTEELKDDLLKAAEEKNDLQLEISSLKRKVSSVSEHDLKSKDLAKEVEKKSAFIMQLQNQIKVMELQLDDIKSVDDQVIVGDDQYSSYLINNRIESKVKERLAEKEKLLFKRLESQMREVFSENVKLQAELERIKLEMEKKIVADDDAVQLVENNNSHLKMKLKQANMVICELNFEIDYLNKKNADGKIVLEEEFKDVELRNKLLGKEKDKLENELEKQLTKVNELTDKVNTLKGEVNKYKVDAKEKEILIENSEFLIDSLNTEIAKLREDSETDRSEKVSNMDEIRKHIEKVEQENQTLVEENERLLIETKRLKDKEDNKELGKNKFNNVVLQFKRLKKDYMALEAKYQKLLEKQAKSDFSRGDRLTTLNDDYEEVGDCNARRVATEQKEEDYGLYLRTEESRKRKSKGYGKELRELIRAMRDTNNRLEL